MALSSWKNVSIENLEFMLAECYTKFIQRNLPVHELASQIENQWNRMTYSTCENDIPDKNYPLGMIFR